MTLFWRLFLSLFCALVVTAAAMGFITHALREIPSSDIDPGGAAALGRLANVVSQNLNAQGIEGVKSMDRRRFRPLLFELDGTPLMRAPHFLDQIAKKASPAAPKVWINEGQVVLGPALVDYQDRNVMLFVVSRAPQGSQPPAPIGLFVVIGTLVALVLAWGLSRITARRIERLKQWSRDLASDLNTPAPADLAQRRDEFGALTRSFEGMAAQIQDQLEAQRALTRMVSHEVRSPLTRLKLVLDLMERAPDAKALLPRAHSQITSLDSLLEQMLTLSRLEANAWAPEAQTQHWSERFKGWAQDWQEQAAEQGVQWQADIAPRIQFSGDEALMHVALNNLVRNALSLSQAGQSLSLSVDEHAQVELTDQAGGIDEARLSEVMEPFVQGERASGSSGLGLPIVAQIARLHGGELILKNIEGGLSARLVLRGLAG